MKKVKKTFEFYQNNFLNSFSLEAKTFEQANNLIFIRKKKAVAQKLEILLLLKIKFNRAKTFFLLFKIDFLLKKKINIEY